VADLNPAVESEAASATAAPTPTPAPVGVPLVGAIAPRAAVALAVASGLLYFLGFAGTDIWPCALIALAPLAVAMHGQSPRMTLLLGGLAGLTMNLTGFYWLLEMLRTFSGFPVFFCGIIMLVLCAYQGARIAFFGWLYGRATARGWPWVPVFLLAFATSELLWPLLFPWYFATSVHQVPALMQLAEFGGPYIVGLVLAAPSLALAEIFLARRYSRPISRRWVAAGLATPLLAASYGYLRIHSVDASVASAPAAHVALVQGNMPLIGTRSDRTEGLDRQVKLTEEARSRGADFTVWSESAVGFNVPEANEDTFLQRLFTRKLGVPTLFGTTVLRQGESRNVFFNTALATDATGHVVGRYDKQFLLAFGEYLPFGETFPVLYDWSPNSGRLQAGKSLEPVTLAGHPVSVLVCYEDILPTFVNSAVEHAHPDMLVNLTNDAWFGDTTEPWIHLALAKLRAVEHRRYLLRASNSGVSAIIDPVGRVVAHGGTFRSEAVEGVAHWMHREGRTGYEMWGDIPWWLAAVAIAAMSFVSRRRSKA
jgi:apolipoprotein N-acyltransferase